MTLLLLLPKMKLAILLLPMTKMALLLLLPKMKLAILLPKRKMALLLLPNLKTIGWFWGALFPRTADLIFHESLSHCRVM